jgi:L-alanine-DL-glutamate epimerase-like enolase superfamily enzyme
MPALTNIVARGYRIPTSSPEADGTLSWKETSLIVVTIETAEVKGWGYSYVSPAAIPIIKDILWPAIKSQDILDIPACWQAMRRAVRNIGQSGVAACAIAAIDIALWDAKAKYLEVCLPSLLGKTRYSIAVYGSGGFTTYGPTEIRKQIDGWMTLGIQHFKIKIGLEDQTDHQRIKASLVSLPANGVLFVDANGAYHAKQALAMAEYLGDYPVTWFEEPVSSDDREGLKFLRERAPAGMDIAAGEYCYTPDDAQLLLTDDSIDVLQIDATRALGVTGFLAMAAQAEAFHRPISAHCAPALHAPLCCNAIDALHVEYFWDHTQIEQMAFDGIPPVRDGFITPSDAPGFGLTFKEKDMEAFAL